jgi:enoyl-CoA hydratase/carnithine racemase
VSGSPDDRVLVEVADRLATVTLNRPGKLNAIDFETYEILERLSAELGGRDDVGAVVLTGAGRAFCGAGADLSQFADNVNFDDPHAVRELLQYVGSVVAKWVHLDKPTVAAVNGIALGGGANLALCCDMLLMREDAAIGQSYLQRGLKRGLLRSPAMDLDTMLDWEALTMASVFQTEDLREAFNAFAEKREPRFTGR